MNNYNTIFNEILKKYGNSEKWSGKMLAITIVICIFLFLTTALILNTIEKKYIVNDELVEILEDLNKRVEKLEKHNI